MTKTGTSAELVDRRATRADIRALAIVRANVRNVRNAIVRDGATAQRRLRRPLRGDAAIEVRRPSSRRARRSGAPARRAAAIAASRSPSPSLARSTRALEHADRLVVDLQRDRERMAVLPAVREREARRIGEAAGRAVDDLGDQRQREQRARADARGPASARRSPAGPRSATAASVLPRRREVDVLRAHVVVRGHAQAAPAARRVARRARRARGRSPRRARRAARRSTRFTISPPGRPSIAACGSSTKLRRRDPRPVVAPGLPARAVHPLLHDDPARRRRRR